MLAQGIYDIIMSHDTWENYYFARRIFSDTYYEGREEPMKIGILVI